MLKEYEYLSYNIFCQGLGKVLYISEGLKELWK